jgi:hypothetical protein
MNELIKDIIKPETGIEIAICEDPEFETGVLYGKPRKGHPEGQVIYHIKEVLENIEKFYGEDRDRDKLRIIAITHDSFKHKVDQTKPKIGDNHHGKIARNFAKKYIDNGKVLSIIETHDDAYNAWSAGGRRGDWNSAERRVRNLIEFLSINVVLYLKFYRCDNATGDKSQENYHWFREKVKSYHKPEKI